MRQQVAYTYAYLMCPPLAMRSGTDRLCDRDDCIGLCVCYVTCKGVINVQESRSTGIREHS